MAKLTYRGVAYYTEQHNQSQKKELPRLVYRGIAYDAERRLQRQREEMARQQKYTGVYRGIEFVKPSDMAKG